MRFLLRFRSLIVAFALALVPHVASAQGITLGVPIGGQTSVTGLPQYITLIYRYAIGIVATVAIVMVVYGGFRYLLGSAYSDVKRGKEIIKDALIGMIVVLGAYVILNTVNPATLTLRMPTLERIRPVDLGFVPATSTAYGGSRGCATDQQCFVQAEAASTGEKCLLYTDLNQNAGGNLAYTNHSGGICTSGAQGQICACSGAGCTVTRGAPGNKGDNVGRWFMSRLSETEQANSTIQGRLQVETTNNNWTAVVDCQAGLTCVPGNADTHFAHTYPLAVCDHTAIVTAEQILQLPEITSDPTNQIPCTANADCQARRPGWSCKTLGGGTNGLCRKACATNTDCGSGACILEAAGTGDLLGTGGTGWCAYGGLVDVCRCSGTGCNLANSNTHNVTYPCNEGLQCGAIQRTKPGMLIPSIGWDYLCVPRTIRPPARAGAGTCTFVCRNPSTTPAGVDTDLAQTISCDGATQAEADAFCLSSCQTGANSCAIRKGTGWECVAPGSGAAQPHCTNWRAPGR